MSHVKPGPNDSVASKRSQTLLDIPLQLSAVRTINKHTVFGVDWSLAGFCSGLALVGVELLEHKALVFAAVMRVGTLDFEWKERRKTNRPTTPTALGQR